MTLVKTGNPGECVGKKRFGVIISPPYRTNVPFDSDFSIRKRKGTMVRNNWCHTTNSNIFFIKKRWPLLEDHRSDDSILYSASLTA